MSGVVSTVGGISASEINAVRSVNAEQSNRASNQANTSLNESLAWYRSNAAARGFVTNSESLSASEFRGAQVITACITTTTESYKYYYSGCNNGSIKICIQCDTISSILTGDPPAETRYYGFSYDNGENFIICTNDNCITFTDIDGGGDGCVDDGSGECFYDVVLKDNNTGAVAFAEVGVTYNSSSREYPVVQSQDFIET